MNPQPPQLTPLSLAILLTVTLWLAWSILPTHAQDPIYVDQNATGADDGSVLGEGMYNLNRSPTIQNSSLWNNPDGDDSDEAPSTFAISGTSVCPNSPIYVNQAASAGGDGASWGTAYRGLSPALADAIGYTATCTPIEVWVARGRYVPGLGPDRTQTFTMTEGVQLYGGFAATETLRTERDWENNVTVLSGDNQNNDIIDANGVVTDTANIVGDNRYHVVTADGSSNPITTDTVLDGFTITAGQANGSSPDNNGGGLYCDGEGSGNECNPTLSNLTFAGNLASSGGGAVYNLGSSSGKSSPTLDNITFIGNAASYGGALYNQGNQGESNPSLNNVTFYNNSAVGYGGAVFNQGSQGESSPSLNNAAFYDNSASDGGAMYNKGDNTGGDSSPTLTNVVFSGNSASNDGGAMVNDGSSSGVSNPTLTNVTFFGNDAAGDGGAIFLNGLSTDDSSTRLNNVILWGNTALNGNQIFNFNATPLISYTVVQSDSSNIFDNSTPTTYGPNIVNSDPLFVDAAGADGITGTLDDDLRLGDNSPAIDAGDNDATTAATDLDGNDRFYNDLAVSDTGSGTAPIVDMGAYEKQSNSGPVPDITLAGNGQVIANGDTSPSLLDGTDFDAVTIGQALTHTFTISNDGDLDLTLSGSPAITLTGGSLFTVTQPASTTLAAGESTTFTLAFAPQSEGSFTDTVTIANDDPDESTYSFVVGGTDTCPDALIYVDQNAAGNNTGDSWADAFTDLQDGLSLAEVCAPIEVWVATGVYTPGLSQSDTFALTSGVAVYGGFAATETLRTERDWEANVTVLSGDIDGNDATDSNGVVTDTVYINGSNNYHIVTGSGTHSSAILDGFTLTAGQANSTGGGGMYNNAGSPSLTNITFSGNDAANKGGAMYNGNDSSPSLSNVVFSSNASDDDGGAMYNNGSSPSLSSVTFSDNSSFGHGAAMYNTNSHPNLTNVTFSGGNTPNAGGGIYNDNSSPSLSNVTFSGNDAYYGGGMYNTNNSNPNLNNVTFLGNEASGGGGIYNYSSSPSLSNVTFSGNTVEGMLNITSHPNLSNVTFSRNYWGMYNTNNSNPTIQNSIFWNNQNNDGVDASAQIYNSSSTPVISYTLIQSATFGGSWDTSLGTDGGHNLDADPLFVDAAGTDGITGTLDDDLRLDDNSPAIDAGDNEAITQPIDLDGNNRFYDDTGVTDTGSGTAPIVDLGAYERQSDSCPFLIYVDQTATGSNNGSTWTDAFTDLQDGLTLARTCAITEIWVATGVYTPGLSQSDAFTLTADIQLYGGFAATETLRTERDPETHITVLSGDIDGDDTTDSNGVVTDTAHINGTNSYHVVWADGVSDSIAASTVLDGFTITAGQADGGGDNNNGGGFYCDGGGSGNACSPSLSSVTFIGNLASGAGGAMFNNGNSGTSSPSLSQVIFLSNQAGTSGGALFNWGYFADSGPSLSNVIFSGNKATAMGGAMFSGGPTSSTPTLNNVTFFGNSAQSGGAMTNYDVNAILRNVILWDNTATNKGDQIADGGSSSNPDISYSLVQGGDSGSEGGASFSDGAGNLNADPLFVDAAGADGVTGTLDDDLSLDDNSPAVDAGDNSAISAATDLAGNNRFYDDAGVADTGSGTAPLVDMGAYEKQTNTLVPEIALIGHGVEISNGDATPNSADDTDFGTRVANSELAYTFTISSTGPDDLSLTGSPAITLSHGTAFTVTQPASTTLIAGASTTFTLTFAPPSEGTFTDTVNISNNDADENPYTFVISGTGACPSPIYVSQNATGSHSGDSWADAFTDLQDGLSLADLCAPSEIWVAAGIYTPGSARTDTFQLTSDVQLYGGFTATETLRTERDWETNVTVLSGDIDGNDLTDANGVVTDTANINGSNSYHVVYGDGSTDPITASTVLDGFTITAGKANFNPGVGPNPNAFAGGLYCYSCDAALNNLTFSGNSALYWGGAMVNAAGSPSLSNVIFSRNSATGGGAMYNVSGSPSLVNVIFSGNSATGGGAIYNIAYDGSHSPSLVNVTFSGNSADDGGAILNYANGGTISPALSNVILWGNTATGNGSQIYNSGATPIISYTLIQSDTSAIYNDNGASITYGPNILTSDPLFVDATGTDGITGTLDDDLRLLPGSPAIDSGDNTDASDEDIAGGSRPVNGVVDMGAYESQGFSLSISGGNNQSTLIDTAFAEPLEVTISSAAAEPVGPGGVISFTAPSSGAGITTSTVTATTNSSGVASVTVTANSTTGSYLVEAAANGVADPANFTLTNTSYITLSLAKSVDLLTSPAEPGDPLTYTLVISNSGNEDATAVTVADTLPTGVSGSNLDWTGTVTAGESLT
ncbi:MAG: choice-of-anchor D domain-containing protein, partial [Anaerolineae bacterium]|nr:choice-of-anchor D domain-containing protein [Anaerolineae bacterium]